jgi:glycosyltransferase involved in cell wall biosynthesis
MRIAIDATTLLLRSAGVKNYVHYWLLSLLAAAPAHGDSIVTYPLAVPVPQVPDHEKSVAGALATWLRLHALYFANIRGNPALDLILLGSDRFHASQHLTNLPRRKTVSSTIFDLSCWITPQYHTPDNIAATRLYAERILKASDGLIAISAHARDDATGILGIPSARIRVVYPGVAESFFDVTSTDAERVREKYRLARPFLLFVGCVEPRKNVPGLIRAYQQTPASFQSDVQLLVVGPFGWSGDEVRRMLTESGENVRYLGYVPEADLPGLFHAAAALVYPSYYEGFGLPVAQAMAAGTPVIASDRASLPEIVGDAGLCVNPDSPDDISAAMQQIVNSSELARLLAARGRSRAETFRWAASAKQSLNFFHDI